MLVTTFQRFNAFTDFFQRGDKFRDISWVDMPETKLALTVIISKSINQTLRGNEEAKVETACSFFNLDLWAERHFNWVTVSGSRLLIGPCICLSILCGAYR